MGKTFRRDNKFRPKKHGRIFTKDDQPWKKHQKNLPPNTPSEDLSDPFTSDPKPNYIP